MDADKESPARAKVIDLIRKYAIQGVPAVRVLGAHLVLIEANAITLGLDWREELVGDPATGALMGGVITTLFDHTAGLASTLALNGRRAPESTLDLRIDYLKPSRRGATLHVRAECYKVSRQIAFYRAAAWHPETPDDLVGSAVGTFMLREPETAQPTADSA